MSNREIPKKELEIDRERTIAKLVTDKQFRRDLFENPESTLKKHGLRLSKRDIAKIRDLEITQVEAVLQYAQSELGETETKIAIVIWD